MQDVLATVRSALCKLKIGQIPFDELDAWNVIEIAALPGNEGVGDANAVTPANKLLREVRSDEAGAAGHEIVRHLNP